LALATPSAKIIVENRLFAKTSAGTAFKYYPEIKFETVHDLKTKTQLLWLRTK
jgi:hypothetical protein